MFPPPQGPGISPKREVDLAYSKEEEKVNEALLMAMSLPRSAFLPRQPGIAPRHGYVKREATITEVLGTGRHPGPDNRMDYSGSYGTYSGTSRPALGNL